MCDKHTANLWTARIMPVLILGLIGYSAYVFVGIVCIGYLLNPDKTAADANMIGVRPGPKRTGAVIGILVPYIGILALTVTTYLHLVYTVTFNPGFTPLGPTALVNLGRSGIGNEAWNPPPSPSPNSQGNGGKDNNNGGNVEKDNNNNHHNNNNQSSHNYHSMRRHHHRRSRSHSNPPTGQSDMSRSSRARSVSQPPNSSSSTAGRPYSGTEAASTTAVARQPLNQLFLRDMYIAESNGEPRWCNKCANWKPDRTHHCSEVGRCVEGFDHFCPWVGGVVGLTSYKFFVQFIFYGSLYALYVVAIMAGYFVEKVRLFGIGPGDSHWIACFGFGGFFGLFLVGMLISTLQLMYWGMTTLENFDRNTKRFYVAKLDPVQRDAVPVSLHPSRQGNEDTRSKRNKTVMPPWEPKKDTDGLDSGYQRRVLLPLSNARPRTANDPSSGISSATTSTDSNAAAATAAAHKGRMVQRYYKLYLTPPGYKPWNLGFKGNFESIMGPSIVYWILPLHRPFNPPRSRDDGDLSDGSWSAKEYRSNMASEGWASGYQGAARAREEARRSWWKWGPTFVAFFREEGAG